MIRILNAKIVDFISDFEVYDEIEVAGNTFVLVHAGLGNFEPDKELWEYELDDLYGNDQIMKASILMTST